MKKTNIVFLTVLGLSGLGFGVNNAISKSDNEGPAESSDAIMKAQTSPQTVKGKQEGKPNEHDRSDLFLAPKALISSPAFKNQPDEGKILGFDFYRDALNAKKPMEAFEETMKKDMKERPSVTKTQQELLQKRYDLTPRLNGEATMTRGKPLPVGPPPGSFLHK